MDLTSLSEYLFTVGILIAFAGTIFSGFMARRHIAKILKASGIRRKHVVGAVIVALIFLTAEVAIVKPTQLLFFDDAIYQAGAVSLLTSGQAWMCNYGSPHACYSGQIFHEPIGASFTLAIGFAIFGVHLAVTYDVMLAVTFLAVLMAFLVGTLLLQDPVAGIFSELILGLSPIVLVWAFPTTPDIHQKEEPLHSRRSPPLHIPCYVLQSGRSGLSAAVPCAFPDTRQGRHKEQFQAF